MSIINTINRQRKNGKAFLFSTQSIDERRCLDYNADETSFHRGAKPLTGGGWEGGRSALGSGAGVTLGDRPTIHDVAARAKVSPATVSRLINGSARVSPASEQAIRRAMEELGYAPSRLAQSFARGSSRTVALFVDGEGQPVQHNAFLMTIALGLNDVLADADYSVRIVHAHRASRTTRTSALSWVRAAWNRREFDGVVITNPTVRDPVIEAVADEEIPAVVIGRYPHAAGIIQVDVDNVGGTRLAATRLTGLGHEAIAFLRPGIAMTAVTDRLQGYLEALARVGVKPPEGWVLKTDGDDLAAFSFEAAQQAVDAEIARGWGFSAVVAFNDEMALGAMRALQEHGMAIPNDVSVVGFDDLPYARMVRPALSTVHQDIRQLGQHAARALLRVVRGEPVPELTIQTVSFVERESAGPAPKARPVEEIGG